MGMCISIPAKVIERFAQSATVEVDGGLRRDVLLAPGLELEPFGWVLLYGPVAVAAISAEEAEEMRCLLQANDHSTKVN
jgi:hydrogenase maturation factor